MRALLLAAVAVAALGSVSAYAAEGEGNGPSFPGLHAVSTGVTTSSADGKVRSVTSTDLLSSSNGAFQSMGSLPGRGSVPTRSQGMIATLSGFNAG